MRPIPYGKQFVDDSDIQSVVDVLSSDWLTQGPEVKEFEAVICKYTGAKYAVAVSSGTAALHIASLAGGLGNGDEAITTPITFAATSNSIMYTSAKPVFADIDYQSVNINPGEIKRKVTKATKAVLPVHFAGLPCDMGQISAVARKNNLLVIEDACHGLGSKYKYKGKWLRVGCCMHSDMTVFSFHPVKHITTGEGGAITTNKKALYDKLCALRNHGIYKDKKTAKKGHWYYDIRELGFNYRITDFQCALGISQLGKIDKFLNKRKSIAQKYNKAFGDIGDLVILPDTSYQDRKHAWHLYILRLRLDKITVDRKRVFAEFMKKNIRVQVHYIPIYWHSFYKENGYGKQKLINAERYYSECISLPIYYDLSSELQGRVIESAKEIIKKYAKKH
jgi:UDP-4-amino-4,6-dideoxy-N-acetyl-beta-L-altrosamine transaminase